MRRTTLALAGVSLTQCLVMAAVGGLPLTALAQARLAQAAPGVKNYAQDLVDRLVARYPDLLEADIHAVPAPGAASVIVASKNPGRIGNRTDPDDLAVFKSGETRIEINHAGDNNVEVAVPVYDVTRHIIGVIELTFPYPPGTDQDALVKRSETMRDQLAARIPNAASLVAAAQSVVPPPRAGAADTVGAGDPLQSEYDKAELGNQQTLPMTKAVTSGEKLEQASQEGYSEAIKGVAGVSPANSKGTANDSVNIRGIKLNLFANYRLNGGLPTVGLITVPNEDKERIETLKGANALMFGVASPAGIINLVTKRAGPVDVTSLAMAGNSFGQIGGSLDVGRRFGDNKELGLRVNASYVHTENGIRDTTGHGKFWSLGYDYRVTDRLTLSGDVEYYTRVAIEQGGVSLLPAVKGVIPITPVPDPRNLLSGTWNVYPPHTTNQTIRADFVVNDQWKLLAETGRSDGDRSRFTVRIGNYNIVTGANGIVTVNSAKQEYKNAFSRFEALGTFDTWFMHHDLTLGVAKTERDAISLGQNQTTLSVRQNIFDPIALPYPTFTKPDTVLPLQTSADVGWYGYDTIGVTKKFRLLVGARRTKDDEATGGFSQSTTVNSPAYGALYDVIPSLTLFASHLQGLEAGATAPATAINANQILPSATSTQKELGIRDSHIRGLSLSASYFEITRANAVTDPTTKIFANSGNIDYKGVESTLSYEFLRRWTLGLAAQWLKAKQVTPDPQFNGFWPENTPSKLGNLSIAYRAPWIAGLTLSAGVSGISYRYVNNQQQATIPGYALYTAGIGYVTRIYGKRVSFQLNGDNLGNLRYWNSVQTGTYGIGMDRSVKFNVRIDL